MTAVPSDFGAHYRRDRLPRGAAEIYDRMTAQIDAGARSGALELPDGCGREEVREAYRALRDDRPEYFFLSPDEFRERIAANEFLEYEEVYTDRFYGTLTSQVEKQLAEGQNVVFDVDVKGGVNIKKHYGDRALSIFIQPPSIAELRRRLEGRATDSPEVINDRIARAEFELGFADKFDHIVVNDDLEKAKQETLEIVKGFLASQPL